MGDWHPDRLAQGDQVAYWRWWGSRAQVLFSAVYRVTATQIELANGMRFRRSDGKQFGGSSTRYWLCDPNGERAVTQQLADIRDTLFREIAHIGKTLDVAMVANKLEMVKAIMAVRDKVATAHQAVHMIEESGRG